MNINDLSTPVLVVDIDRLDGNLERMAARSDALGVRLRPHIKTHKCIEIARKQEQLGCAGITVSTLYEARVFATHGFGDITWAYPLVLSRTAEARQIADQTKLQLTVDSAPAIDRLEDEEYPFRVWLKVDCGYHRAGIDPTGNLGPALAHRLSTSDRLRFEGILTHSGHAYKAQDAIQMKEVAEQERSVMTAFADRLRTLGIDVPAVSIGSTPAMSVAEDLRGVDEARPGNYVFYDKTQVDLGSCEVADCAVTVVTSVISNPETSLHSVVDAGALALSKDLGVYDSKPVVMGRVFDHYPSSRLSSSRNLYGLSQEHGLVSASLPVGTRLRILPNHSCLTVACFDEFAVAKDDEIIDTWKIWRGR